MTLSDVFKQQQKIIKQKSPNLQFNGHYSNDVQLFLTSLVGANPLLFLGYNPTFGVLWLNFDGLFYGK